MIDGNDASGNAAALSAYGFRSPTDLPRKSEPALLPLNATTLGAYRSILARRETASKSPCFKPESCPEVFGDVGESDGVAALEFYTWAAVRGDAFAQLQLGHMYATGQGVAQDLVTAYAWLNLATISLPPGLEHDWTVASREFVARHLRPAEIAEAHRQMGKMVVDGVRAPARTPGDISVETEIHELGFLESVDLFSGHS